MSLTKPHDDDPRPPSLTERDREMAHEIARHTSQHVVARLIDLAQDEAVIERVTSKWSREAQRVVGAAVFRFAFYLLGVIAVIASIKVGLVGLINDFIGNIGGRQP